MKRMTGMPVSEKIIPSVLYREFSGSSQHIIVPENPRINSSVDGVDFCPDGRHELRIGQYRVFSFFVVPGVSFQEFPPANVSYVVYGKFSPAFLTILS
jgi:hypothetical protein